MSGRQVYISSRHHKKLKVLSALEEKDMGDIVEEKIDDIDLPNWEELYAEYYGEEVSA